MKRSYRITPLASKDIEAIADYLARESSLASSESFLKTLNKTLKRLANFPELGRKRDELSSGVRSLPCKSYLIFYRLSERTIEILRVISGYQDLEALFEED